MKTKKCFDCKQTKPLSEFHKKKDTADGHHNHCKVCKSAYSRNRYATNAEVRERVAQQSEERKMRNRKFVYDILQKSQCIDCGDSRWEVLEFDHVRDLKEHGICYMVLHGFTLDAIQKEIDKCEIRCASCHRLKTIKQFDWIKATWNQ